MKHPLGAGYRSAPSLWSIPPTSIEQCIATRDGRCRHVPPGNGDPKRRPRFARGARCGGEASDPMPALAAVALRKIERDRSESPAKLIRQVPIEATNRRDNRSKGRNGIHREVEDHEPSCVFSGLHTPPSDRTMTAATAANSQQNQRALAWFFRHRAEQTREHAARTPTRRTLTQDQLARLESESESDVRRPRSDVRGPTSEVRRPRSGERQGSCRLIRQATRSLATGFKVTLPTGCQLRVLPVHRRGERLLAAR